MTSVVSDRKGILLIAGGGGGASPGGAGGKGGSMESVLGQQEGEAGMAGGGAGYYGGTAGEKIVHHHTNDCYRNASSEIGNILCGDRIALIPQAQILISITDIPQVRTMMSGAVP